MSMEAMYKLEDMVCRELDEIARNGKIGNLDVLDKLVHTEKGLATIIAMKEAEGGSYDDGGMSGRRGYSRREWGYARDNSYDGGSYRGSYDDGGASYRRRDSLGRFSRDDGNEEMKNRIRRFQQDAKTDKERDAYAQVLDLLENMNH